ncbi:MAG: hypothetical protein E6G01_13995 [Actinobacteria bacterium]|nr:MAG: hypothetical protein E6G01_13995 [Actinomycetota bacterium]
MATRVLAQRYELLEALGSGAMATVWRAHDRRLDREVAIKVLSQQLASDQSFRDRFEREAVHVASLKHPNIVTVYDSGSEGESYYIIMELVEGESLQSALARASPYMPLGVVPELGKELLAGLSHAHQKGIVHRDIKPANILITREGTAKLADFGIARAASDAESFTATGSFIGTPSYSSPEQLGSRPATPATDLYSLGCVLYHCLAGHPPFEAELPVGVIAQHLESAPRPLREQRPEVPAALEGVVLRALEKDPERRFASADEMSRSLVGSGVTGTDGASGSLSTVVHPGGLRADDEPLRPGRRRPRRWLLLVAAAAVAVVTARRGPFLPVPPDDVGFHGRDVWGQRHDQRGQLDGRRLCRPATPARPVEELRDVRARQLLAGVDRRDRARHDLGELHGDGLRVLRWPVERPQLPGSRVQPHGRDADRVGKRHRWARPGLPRAAGGGQPGRRIGARQHQRHLADRALPHEHRGPEPGAGPPLHRRPSRLPDEHVHADLRGGEPGGGVLQLRPGLPPVRAAAVARLGALARLPAR